MRMLSASLLGARGDEIGDCPKGGRRSQQDDQTDEEPCSTMLDCGERPTEPADRRCSFAPPSTHRRGAATPAMAMAKKRSAELRLIRVDHVAGEATEDHRVEVRLVISRTC